MVQVKGQEGIMRKIKCMLAVILVLFVEAAAIVLGGDYLKGMTVPYKITFAAEDSDCFRQQMISDENVDIIKKFSKKYSISPIRVLAAFMASNEFSLGNGELNNLDKKQFDSLEKYLHKHYNKEYEALLTAYGKVWKDVKYFPVAVSKSNKDATVSYEDSWMYERNFGGKRGHEGTDIMAGVNKRGYYPIISMTDGVVEKIGWLTKGGYRIGVRSPSGGYYYYAHLYKYAENFQVGDSILAGQLLGYMGDSGYGSEGTVGQFAVHLHVGMYINDDEGKEISLNPYGVLKYVEDKTVTYDY